MTICTLLCVAACTASESGWKCKPLKPTDNKRINLFYNFPTHIWIIAEVSLCLANGKKNPMLFCKVVWFREVNWRKSWAQFTWIHVITHSNSLLVPEPVDTSWDIWLKYVKLFNEGVSAKNTEKVTVHAQFSTDWLQVLHYFWASLLPVCPLNQLWCPFMLKVWWPYQINACKVSDHIRQLLFFST